VDLSVSTPHRLFIPALETRIAQFTLNFRVRVSSGLNKIMASFKIYVNIYTQYNNLYIYNPGLNFTV
jgi:hypothetical protein